VVTVVNLRLETVSASRPSSRGAPGAGGADPLDLVRLRVAAGADPGDLGALGGRTATLVRVATEAGAPLLPALDAAAVSDAATAEAARAVTVASAQGRAVAGGLLLAPVVLVPVLGRVFDVDLVVYHRTPLGMLTGGLAVLLLVTGSVLARRAVASVGRPPRHDTVARRRVHAVVGAALAALVVHPVVGAAVLAALLVRARPRPPAADPVVADAAELTATAVGGGWPPPSALRLAARELEPAGDLAAALRRLAFDLEHGLAGGDHPPGVARLADVLTTATAVGAPVAPTLRRLAADVRSDELARVLAAAERLPVRLTFPTALCLLPGTLLLVGAPIVTAGLGTVGT
jgi:hypothetical protein